MDTLLEILRGIDCDIDFENEKGLITDRLLDSFGLIMLVGELETHFDIRIEASEMMPENFDSAEDIYRMILRLGGNS